MIFMEVSSYAQNERKKEPSPIWLASQIVEKQSAIQLLNDESVSITANINALKAELKARHTELKSAEKDVTGLSRVPT